MVLCVIGIVMVQVGNDGCGRGNCSSCNGVVTYVVRDEVVGCGDVSDLVAVVVGGGL